MMNVLTVKPTRLGCEEVLNAITHGIGQHWRLQHLPVC